MTKNLVIAAAGVLAALLHVSYLQQAGVTALTLRPSVSIDASNPRVSYSNKTLSFVEEGAGKRPGPGGGGPPPKAPRGNPPHPGALTRQELEGAREARRRHEESVRQAQQASLRRSPRMHPGTRAPEELPARGTVAARTREAAARDAAAADPRSGVAVDEEKARRAREEMNKRVQEGAGKSHEQKKTEMHKELIEKTEDTRKELDADAEERRGRIDDLNKVHHWQPLRASDPLRPKAKEIVDRQRRAGWPYH